MRDYTPIFRVIAGETVFGLDIDSRIRQAANQMTARAFIELLNNIAEDKEDWAFAVSEALSRISSESPSVLIGFDDGQWDRQMSVDCSESTIEPSVHYLKLKFTDEDAAYYQFHLFPRLDEPYLMGAARKREGLWQHLKVDLSSAGVLQAFIQNLRSNPHLVAVEESSEDEFSRAPSNSI